MSARIPPIAIKTAGRKAGQVTPPFVDIPPERAQTNAPAKPDAPCTADSTRPLLLTAPLLCTTGCGISCSSSSVSESSLRLATLSAAPARSALESPLSDAASVAPQGADSTVWFAAYGCRPMRERVKESSTTCSIARTIQTPEQVENRVRCTCCISSWVARDAPPAVEKCRTARTSFQIWASSRWTLPCHGWIITRSATVHMWTARGGSC